MIMLASEQTAYNPHDNLVPRLRDIDEVELVAQCQEEIPHRLDAFRELVTRFEPEVFETCFRLVADKVTAEKICEDAFLQVFHQIQHFQPGNSHSSLKVWIFQIVHRLSELHQEGKTFSRNQVPSNLADPMMHALGYLDWDQRSWIVLRFVGCLQTREIAEIFEIGGREANERIYLALSRFREASELIAA